MILYTGTNPDKYASLGQVIHFPMIEILPVTLDSAQRELFIEKIDSCEVILLTSRYAVKYFVGFIVEEKLPYESIKMKDFFVVGNDTKTELMKMGIEPSVQPDEETSQGLFEEIEREYTVKGKSILFPRSSITNTYLKDNLVKSGANVDEFVIYQNAKPEKRILPQDAFETIIFTSPSTVKNFLEDYSQIPSQWGILCKGPVTQKYLKNAGYESEIINHE